jgi:hypothetical protein
MDSMRVYIYIYIYEQKKVSDKVLLLGEPSTCYEYNNPFY